MSRSDLLLDLAAYRILWIEETAGHRSFDPSEETAATETLEAFIRADEQCFARTNLTGHVTGSALVVSPDFDQILLTKHAKLGRWLQLGGHADDHPLVAEVAMREALEESGLQELSFCRHPLLQASGTNLLPLPFDLDVHTIPANQYDPEHLHYDLRYLIVASPEETPQMTAESDDLRWFSLEEARAVTSERSMTRQFDKLELLRWGSQRN